MKHDPFVGRRRRRNQSDPETIGSVSQIDKRFTHFGIAGGVRQPSNLIRA
jgi:hypothetical protein